MKKIGIILVLFALVFAVGTYSNLDRESGYKKCCHEYKKSDYDCKHAHGKYSGKKNLHSSKCCEKGHFKKHRSGKLKFHVRGEKRHDCDKKGRDCSYSDKMHKHVKAHAIKGMHGECCQKKSRVDCKYRDHGKPDHKCMKKHEGAGSKEEPVK